MRNFHCVLLCSAALLGGCATLGKGGAEGAGTEPAEAVIRQIKQDLGSYLAYEARASQTSAQNNACEGRVNFKVQSITVALTTVTEVTSEGTAEAAIPIGAVKLGPSGSYTRGRQSSQNLSFTVVPDPRRPAAAEVSAPRPDSFDAVLRGLREAMLRVSDTPPCLTFPAAEKQDNSIEFGFTVTRAASGGVDFSFLIFSLGASHSRSREVANAVTVKFVADEGSFLAPPP